MPFKKGYSGNLKGRPKGTVSEKTLYWNALKDWVMNEGAQKFIQEIMSLSGPEYVKNYSLVAEYFQPKLQRIDGTINNIETRVIHIVKPKGLELGQSDEIKLLDNEPGE